MNNIVFRKIEDSDSDYNLLFKWCSKPYIYEWFEQRLLTKQEIINKYRNKINSNQYIFIIQIDSIPIGYIQYYKFNNDKYISFDDKYKNIYEVDLFIGEEEYLNKGLGKLILDNIFNLLKNNYNMDLLVIRPFSRNKRAINSYLKSGFEKYSEYMGLDTLGNPELITCMIRKV